MAKRQHSISSTIGLLLMIIGLGTILAAGTLYTYAQYERFRIEHDLTIERVFASQAAVPADSFQDASPVASETDRLAEETEQVGTDPLPTAESPAVDHVQATKPAVPASRVVIPKIGVDTIVKEAKIENSQWQVPKFVAGHLEGTANPGENGNVVLAGHIESISSGNVFARLNELRSGDAITVFAGDQEFSYRISEIKTVPNDDLSVVEQTGEERITLITCAGTFNILTRDYSHRLIVIAEPTA